MKYLLSAELPWAAMSFAQQGLSCDSLGTCYEYPTSDLSVNRNDDKAWTLP